MPSNDDLTFEMIEQSEPYSNRVFREEWLGFARAGFITIPIPEPEALRFKVAIPLIGGIGTMDWCVEINERGNKI